MINLLELVSKYVDNGYNEIYANAKVAQDIILKYLFKSKYKNNITLKGGIVMFNLTNDKRRATIDIDLDLIRIYLADDNIYEIFTSHKLKGIDIYVDVNKITDLKHQDYKGKRIPILIRDTFNNEIETKIDIGVHTEYDIKQDELTFNSFIDDENITLYVNSKEQIFVEKIIPMLKFGFLSTRYKDFYDLYWLIKNTDLNNKEILKIMNDKIFSLGINGICSLDDLIITINKIFSNKNYLKKLQEKKNNWIEVDSYELKDTILNFLNKINLNNI